MWNEGSGMFNPESGAHCEGIQGVAVAIVFKAVSIEAD
jgi:hypothetical protein